MQIQLATVTQKGQVTIPLDIRNLLGIRPYSRIEFVVSRKKVQVKPTVDILDLAGKFKIPKGAPGILEARKLMEKNYSRF